jgi:hypothetical protein
MCNGLQSVDAFALSQQLAAADTAAAAVSQFNEMDSMIQG